jgi:ATP-dependent DNA helicase RecG
MLHRMEAVEHIGSGIKRIRNLCREYGVTEPRIEVSEHWFTMIFLRPGLQGVQEQAEIPQVPRKYPASTPQVVAMLIAASTEEISREQLQAAAGMKDREHFRKAYLNVLLDSGLLEMTVPGKPRSSKQRYRLTAFGRQFLEQQDKDGS